MPDLTPADRVVALLEWGDVTEADAAIEAAAGADDEDWQVALWRGARALMEGRFLAAERLAAQAAEQGEPAREPQAAMLATLLIVALRREQQRPAEAEILLRGLLDEYPSAPMGAHAGLAAVIGEMGRDSQARQELARLLPREPVPATGRLAALYQLAELAAAVGANDEAGLLYRRLLPHARDFAVEEGGAGFYGSVSLVLGRLAHALDDWDAAVAHLEEAAEAHTRVGAPVLLAHTTRHLAALLRLRGDAGDWERAVELLSTAAGIYTQLGVDGLAAETHEVLARSEDGLGMAPGPAGDEPALFRRQGDAWLLGPPASPVKLRDAQGMRDIAKLLIAPGRSVHVADLLGSRPAGRSEPIEHDRPLALVTRRPWVVNEPLLDDATRAQYEGRLAELAGELVEAERLGDAIRAALARAERDSLTAALSGADVGDPLERARRMVGTRIRISLSHIERAEPELGRHLRTSVHTGTFCSYEPDRPVRWAL